MWRTTTLTLAVRKSDRARQWKADWLEATTSGPCTQLCQRLRKCWGSTLAASPDVSTDTKSRLEVLSSGWPGHRLYHSKNGAKLTPIFFWRKGWYAVDACQDYSGGLKHAKQMEQKISVLLNSLANPYLATRKSCQIGMYFLQHLCSLGILRPWLPFRALWPHLFDVHRGEVLGMKRCWWIDLMSWGIIGQ